MSLFSKPQIYTVHINPANNNAVEKAVFVREGFSVYAFIFGVLWALYHRAWGFAIFLGVFAVLFGVAEHSKWMDRDSLAIIQLAFSFLVGYHANDCRRASLAKRGYIMSDVVASDNEMRAQQRYFDRMVAA